MEEGLSARVVTGQEGGCSSAQDNFNWKRSDNSFAFNFLPEAPSSLNHNTATLLEDQPQLRQHKESEPGSGFAFNFQIPTSQSDGLETTSLQAGKTEIGTAKLSSDSSKSNVQKKKKKKGARDKEDGLKEKMDMKKTNADKMIEEPPKPENTELSPEQQFSRELDWCIEQLELGLRTQKSSAKQREEASRALKTLRSSKAPVVKKRQVMRGVSGDYRKKMEEEKKKQFKLIQSAMTSAKVTTVSEPSRKPVFHRCASTMRPSTDIPQDTFGLSHGDGDVGKFVFRPTHEEFCFNFDL